MSASRSRSSRSARSSRSVRSARSPLSSNKKASPAVAAARAPWIEDGIDYGPARAAIQDLATWALAIAERAVDDWPAGRVHVRNTRRFVEAHIDGKRARRVSLDDVLFTAGLLARIFDEDLGLDFSDALQIFDTLALPVDVVPMPRQAPRAVRAPMLTLHTLARSAASSAPVPPPLRFCDECGYVHEPGGHVGHRNAA